MLPFRTYATGKEKKKKAWEEKRTRKRKRWEKRGRKEQLIAVDPAKSIMNFGGTEVQEKKYTGNIHASVHRASLCTTDTQSHRKMNRRNNKSHNRNKRDIEYQIYSEPHKQNRCE